MSQIVGAARVLVGIADAVQRVQGDRRPEPIALRPDPSAREQSPDGAAPDDPTLT